LEVVTSYYNKPLLYSLIKEKMNNSDTNKLNKHLDILVEVLLDNYIYYIPSEIIFEGIIDSMQSELPEKFFDELSFYDNSDGCYCFDNTDSLEINQRLLKKKSQLDANTQYLVQLTKSISEQEFIYLYNEYADRVFFYIHISKWLSENVQKYNKELHLTIIGSFRLQLEYLKYHLKDIYEYFGELLFLDLNEAYTTEAIISKYFPDIIARIEKTIKDDKNEIVSTSLEITAPVETKETAKRKKKEKPVLIDQDVENEVLKAVFNINL